MNEAEVIATFLRRDEAETAKSFLESQGIKSIISSDDCGGMRPGMSFGSAITMSVLKADIEKAKKLLKK